ncbi:unnamed protein product, partial [Mycena citricolor]
QVLPSFRPPGAIPFAHAGTLQLVRNCQQNYVLRVDAQICTELYGPVDGDLHPIGVFVLVEKRIELAGRGSDDRCLHARTEHARVARVIEISIDSDIGALVRFQKLLGVFDAGSGDTAELGDILLHLAVNHRKSVCVLE